MPRPDLLLLHGALGASGQFDALLPLLGDYFELHTLDFEGHGSGHATEDPFSMDRFSANVLDFLSAHNIERTYIFGYSMGGYVACLVALARPGLVEGIVTLGTKCLWNKESAAKEVALLNPEKIAAKVPRFAQTLAARHTSLGWETVLHSTAAMLSSLGEAGGFPLDALSGLQIPVRVMVGDRDSTVSVEEAAQVYRALPLGQLEVLPGTLHQFERVPVERLAASIVQFFNA
ncbi:MAG: alpha/beta hydrolase [Chloroflexota bacterium]